jgi:hypothetical protein
MRVRALQQQWGDYLGIPTEFKNSVGISFVLVPPSDFRMGGTSAQLDGRRGRCEIATTLIGLAAMKAAAAAT